MVAQLEADEKAKKSLALSVSHDPETAVVMNRKHIHHHLPREVADICLEYAMSWDAMGKRELKKYKLSWDDL